MASLYQRGELWWAKYRVGGQVVRVSTGCTKKRAAQDWLDIRAGKIAAGEPLPVKLDSVTYDDLRADLDAVYAVKEIRSRATVEYRMRYLDAAFKGWRVVAITESVIDAYVARRKTEHVPGAERLVAAATINLELAQLRRMLRLGYRRRKLAHVPTITVLPESQPRQGFVEEADFQAIVKHLDDDVHLAATIAFETAANSRRGADADVGARRRYRGVHPARRRALEEWEAARCVPESRRHRRVGHTPGPGGQGARSHPGTRLRPHRQGAPPGPPHP